MTQVMSRPCCDSHKDWPQLTQHMVEGFPDVPLVEIVGIVNRTRRAVCDFGLAEAEHLATAEIIVRHQLAQLNAEGAAPRLDPKKRRARPPAA